MERIWNYIMYGKLSKFKKMFTLIEDTSYKRVENRWEKVFSNNERLIGEVSLKAKSDYICTETEVKVKMLII